VRNGLADGRLTLAMPGGELRIEVRPDWSIRLRGPVAEVCEGTLSADLLDALRRKAPLPFE
jgi:diaminopimelate epimerase